MQHGPDPWRRLILPDLEHDAGCLDLCLDAPPGDECARPQQEVMCAITAATASMAPTSGPSTPKIPNMVPAVGAVLRNVALSSPVADNWQTRWSPP
jgi:hypothetical protein